MNKTIENLKSGNYSVVDNQGVSVTGHFIDCLGKEIADLEAKLAESNESHHKNIVELTKISTEKDRKIEELKQQLAEKEKIIDNLNKQFLKDIENVKKWWIYQYEGNVERENQDKISFAIAELEKIKDKFREIYDKNRKHHLSVVKCYELVDEQIAELSNENERTGE